MVSSTAQTLAKGDALGTITRPARALIGWIAPEEAKLCLAGRRLDKVGDPEYAQRVESAHEAAEKRAPGIDQANVLADAPAELADYLGKLQASQAGAAYFAEGWSVRVADLTKVCALQPSVFWDHAKERTANVEKSNLVSAATVTLPLPSVEPMPLQFDPHRNTWMIVSRNPNLKLIGHFSDQVPQFQGAVGCGFIVAFTSSFVQVALYRGRYVLRDGYHRALGLLARGVERVPVLFKEFSPHSDLGLGQGMLAGDAYLGDRPPLLPDYLDNAVSAEVHLPASQKMVVVQGMEMTPLG